MLGRGARRPHEVRLPVHGCNLAECVTHSRRGADILVNVLIEFNFSFDCGYNLSCLVKFASNGVRAMVAFS